MSTRTMIFVAALGMVLLAPVTTALFMIATREPPPVVEEPVGRYQFLESRDDHRIHLLDTATGEVYRLERTEWLRISESIAERSARKWREPSTQQQTERWRQAPVVETPPAPR